MEILIIILVLVGTIGMFSLLLFYLDALPMVEPLEKLEYIAQMGTVLAPCIVMSTDEFGEPYTVETWGITIALILGCLILNMFCMFCIEWIEDRADTRQIKRQKKNKQKAVKNLLGREAVNKFKDKACVKKVEDTNTNSKPKEKRTIKVTFAMLLAQAKGSTLAAAIFAPILIVINEGIDELLNPLCILTVFLGLGLSFLCEWSSKKISPEIWGIQQKK